MKRTSSVVRTGLIILLSAWIFVGCASDREGYTSSRQQKKVERSTPQFNPAYFNEVDRRHIAIFFDISNGVLTPSQRPAETRPGRLPYTSASAGNVLVVYEGADGKVIGQYAIDDPMLFRSCDFDSSWIGETKPIESGTIEILLPYDRTITTVEVGRIDGKPTVHKVDAQIMRRIKADEER